MSNSVKPLRIAGVGYCVPDTVITNEDLIKSLSKERQESINNEVKKNISKWGGARIGAGRKPSNNVLKFTRRLSEKENKYIDYLRKNHINIDDLMEG